MLTLFFTKESFGNFFFELIEMRELQSIFKRIDSGIQLEEHIEEIKELFLHLENESHLERFISFLKILKYISTAKTKSLSSFIYSKVYSDDEGERMSNVMNHAISNFNKDITLNEVSNIANMSPNAFCRYFKQRTNKTFFQFLLEIRLEHASRLLLKSKDMTVSEISDDSGFKNISNFNRKFKEFHKVTPTSFRKGA
jgi:AraC-like DNA-binding protein